MFGKPTIFYDVDDTLVMWNKPVTEESINCILNGITYSVLPNWKHIDLLKKHWKEGYKIVVWSGSGEDWVTEVLLKLDLNEFVDVRLSKPSYYVDDLECQQFMYKQKRIYHDGK